MSASAQLLFSPQQLEEARTKVPLSEIVARRVKLVRKGGEFVGLCPFHNEKTPSFCVNDRKGHAWCMGCGWHGDAITFTMQLDSRGFVEVVKELLAGSFEGSSSKFERQFRAAADAYKQEEEDEKAKIRAAAALWERRQPIKGSVAETYLRHHRKLLPPWPQWWGFIPDLFFSPIKEKRPALICALTDRHDAVTAVQRIFLNPTTGDKAEPRKESKRTMGVMGRSSVKLGPVPTRRVGIAEGNETGFSAQRLYCLPVWVSCGAIRMKEVAKIIVGMENIEEVVVFRDNGEVGLREAIAAAEIIDDTGRHTWIEAPGGGLSDFNSVMQQQRAAVATA